MFLENKIENNELKKEYKFCIEYSEDCSNRLEGSLIKFIRGEANYISIISLFYQQKEIEIANCISKLYEDLFDEKIS